MFYYQEHTLGCNETYFFFFFYRFVQIGITMKNGSLIGKRLEGLEVLL